MNVFDYIQDYVNRSNTGLYGDFLQSNEEDAKIELQQIQWKLIRHIIKLYHQIITWKFRVLV